MSIKELIESRIEDNSIATKIITLLERHNQKPLTKRHIDELKTKVDDSIYLSKRFGMTHIEWKQNGDDRSMLISHAIKNVKVDTVDIVDRNQGYFGASRERNLKRRATLQKPERMAQLEQLIADFKSARHLLETALEHGGDFCPDRHTIMETFDLNEGI
jgi:hypothetical protein